MDPRTAEIAAAVVAFLSPYLAEGGKAAAKKAGEALMAALERRFKGKPAAEEALQDVKAAPQDTDAQAALRLQLEKSLAADADFLAELTRLLERAEAETPPAAVRRIVVADDHSVAVGRDLKGDITITG